MAVRLRPVCVPDVGVEPRPWSHPPSLRSSHPTSARADRAAMISAAITAFFGIQGLFIGQNWWVSVVNLGGAAAFVMIPRLCGMAKSSHPWCSS